jgi:hypothetical protein
VKPFRHYSALDVVWPIRLRAMIETALSRRSFLAAGVATATAAFAATGVAQASERACCPVRMAPMLGVPDPLPLAAITAGNQHAMDLAKKSKAVMDANDAAMAMADALPDQSIRTKTLEVLRNPAPTYQLRSPSRADKEAVRQELLAAGLITEQVTIEGIFPPVGDPNEAPQAFWSAPGNTYAGHHSFPGGLVVHEWTNASLAQQFLTSYDARYGLVSESNSIDRSIAAAAPLWHDINKVTVFQWNDDGSEFVEQAIADTGGHHPLSGAEAIVRGMSPDFVVALLGAHDPPQIGVSMQRLVNYIRAAAIIARVDPVAVGLLRPSDVAGMPAGLGLNQVPARIEGHINHLSDHDFVFTGDSAALLIRTLQDLAPQYGIDPPTQVARFDLFRNTVFAQLTDMRLYGVLQTGGVAAVKAKIDALDLSALSA